MNVGAHLLVVRNSIPTRGIAATVPAITQGRNAVRPILPIAALAALLSAAPAAAQTQAPSQPHAAPNAAASGGALDPGTRQAVERLASETTAAKQASIRATDKNTARTVELLGDHIALTQGELSRRLAEMAGANAGSDVRMPEDAAQTVQRLTTLNGRPFAEQYIGFVRDVYPRIIQDLEQLGRSPGFKDLADSVLPTMREELAAADRIGQGAYDDPQLAQQLERGLPPARKDSQTFSRSGNNAQGSSTAPTAGSSGGDQTGRGPSGSGQSGGTGQ